MKRFFCTTCNLPRRVRRLPNDLDLAGNGTCRWHLAKTHTSFVRAEQRKHAEPPKPKYEKRFEAPRPAPKKKGRRGESAEAVA